MGRIRNGVVKDAELVEKTRALVWGYVELDDGV